MQIVTDLIFSVWLIALSFAVLKLLDKSDPIQEQQTETIDDAWSPVELTDDREFEMQEQERRREFFKV